MKTFTDAGVGNSIHTPDCIPHSHGCHGNVITEGSQLLIQIESIDSCNSTVNAIRDPTKVFTGRSPRGSNEL